MFRTVKERKKIMINGKAIKFGDNVDTDQIIPAQYLNLLDINNVAKFTFEYDENFLSNFTNGDICVGGSNFGCGSSREQAPAVLKIVGVKAIVAKNFARIFYRNSINLGIPLIECDEADDIGNLDKLSLNIAKGVIDNLTKGKRYKIKSFPDFVQRVLDAGGIVNYKRSIE